MIKYFMKYSKNILIFRKILKVSFYKDRSIEFCYHIWQHGRKHDFQNKFDKKAGGSSKKMNTDQYHHVSLGYKRQVLYIRTPLRYSQRADLFH